MTVFPLLTCKDAAEYLGTSERTIRSATTSKEHPLPHFKLGRPGSKSPIRFSRDDLDEWQLGAIPEGLDPRPELLTDPFDQIVENIDRQNAIDRIKRRLPEREWKILSMRWGLAPYTHPHTYDEIGKELELTRERVGQLQHEAERRAQLELERDPDTKPAPPRLYIDTAWWNSYVAERTVATDITVYTPKDAEDAERYVRELNEANWERLRQQAEHDASLDNSR